MHAAPGKVQYLTANFVLVAVELFFAIGNTSAPPVLDVLRSAARQFQRSEYLTNRSAYSLLAYSESQSKIRTINWILAGS